MEEETPFVDAPADAPSVAVPEPFVSVPEAFFQDELYQNVPVPDDEIPGYLPDAAPLPVAVPDTAPLPVPVHRPAMEPVPAPG
eukprot:2922409-Lingulodinium_polyedra.AAC.1